MHESGGGRGLEVEADTGEKTEGEKYMERDRREEIKGGEMGGVGLNRGKGKAAEKGF